MPDGLLLASCTHDIVCPCLFLCLVGCLLCTLGCTQIKMYQDQQKRGLWSRGVAASLLKDLDKGLLRVVCAACRFLVLEYCSCTLGYGMQANLMHHRNGVPMWEMVLRLLLDVARGMLHLHSRNIIHGDLKVGQRPHSAYVPKSKGGRGAYTPHERRLS